MMVDSDLDLMHLWSYHVHVIIITVNLINNLLSLAIKEPLYIDYTSVLGSGGKLVLGMELAEVPTEGVGVEPWAAAIPGRLEQMIYGWAQSFNTLKM